MKKEKSNQREKKHVREAYIKRNNSLNLRSVYMMLIHEHVSLAFIYAKPELGIGISLSGYMPSLISHSVGELWLVNNIIYQKHNRIYSKIRVSRN